MLVKSYGIENLIAERIALPRSMRTEEIVCDHYQYIFFAEENHNFEAMKEKFYQDINLGL